MATILVGMSGGVDSAVAAALLVRAGHTVHGAFLHLWQEENVPDAKENPCCSTEGLERASRVCAALGIPLHVLNVAERFKEEVVDTWLDRSAAGETPNPCPTCNRQVKIPVLLEHARALGCDRIATGHYAQLIRSDGTATQLHRARDLAKDQSFMLARLTQEQLDALELPVGETTKPEVRALAATWKLPDVATTKDSQQLCFIADSVPQFLQRQRPHALTPGPVQDVAGTNFPQEHHGLALYTIGQRSGLPVSGTRTPRYVYAKNTETNTLVLGGEEALIARACTLRALVLRASLPATVLVQVRSHANVVPASWTRDGDTLSLTFQTPVRSVVPGQEAALYEGNHCIGSGTIHVVTH